MFQTDVGKMIEIDEPMFPFHSLAPVLNESPRECASGKFRKLQEQIDATFVLSKQRVFIKILKIFQKRIYFIIHL